MALSDVVRVFFLATVPFLATTFRRATSTPFTALEEMVVHYEIPLSATNLMASGQSSAHPMILMLSGIETKSPSRSADC